MQIELRKDFTYSLVVPTSMGVRITPVNGQPVHCSDTFVMQATSAETNVASISSYLGLPVKVLDHLCQGQPDCTALSKTILQAGIWPMKARKFHRAAHGVTVISSILPTADMVPADREYITTVQAKSDGL